MKTHYEYIVLGCGGIGSGALYWLARRAGGEVLGLEQFQLFHPNGGSHDYSRIIRLAYDHEAYARLAPHTYTAWATLEEESGVRVVTKTGGVVMAPGGSQFKHLIDSYAQAMSATGSPYERFGGDELMRRYPQFHFDHEVDVIFQADTGIADPSQGNAAHIGMARYYGAAILDHRRVTGLQPFDGGVDVQTGSGMFTCRKLIVAAGAWTDPVLASVGMALRITVTQEQVTYYATPNLREFGIGRFPVFIWEDPAEAVYGFPVYGEVATKAAIDASGPSVTADTRTFEPDVARERRLESWLGRYLPGFLGPKLYTKTCLYDMPRDRHFVLDALPGHPQILVFCGAGHAYKFASLVGKILSQLAIDEGTAYPIAAFTLQRPAISDPHYPPVFQTLDTPSP